MPKTYTNLPNSIIDDTMPFGGGSKKTLEPDYDEAYQGWKASDTPQTRGMLLRKVQPVLDTAVYTYAGKNASPAVKSQARLMALDAFKTYDPAKGNMKNHLMATLRRLQRTAAQGQQIISIPERVALDRRHLREAEEALRDSIGRDPSDAEIADYTGLSLKRIGHVRQAASPVNSGSILDEQGEVYAPPSSIPGANQNDEAWQDMVYYDLEPTNQAIMDYTLGLHGAPTLENREIANRLGITAGAVSQRKAKIQAMLDERFMVGPFGG